MKPCRLRLALGPVQSDSGLPADPYVLCWDDAAA